MAITVLPVFGTRPEAIKLAPVISELRRRGDVETRVIITAQHREMIDQALRIFRIAPDVDLDIMTPGQSLDDIVRWSMAGIAPVFKAINPDLVLVQGDTTSAMAIALAAAQREIPVGHVEAGLRTHDKSQPFPEELNRQLIGRIASMHFAPTESAKNNLTSEGIPSADIFVTGNTIVDAIMKIAGENHTPENPQLAGLDLEDKKVVLVTTHRRESFGAPLENVCKAVKQIAVENPDIVVVLPVHPNPNVCGTIKPFLSDIPNVNLIEPLSYADLVWLLSRCYMAITDSGGLQEEAPTFKVPVLVLRDKTERPEGIEAGVAKLVGTDFLRIVGSATDLLTNEEIYKRMSARKNPYGDGHASERIAEAIINRFS